MCCPFKNHLPTSFSHVSLLNLTVYCSSFALVISLQNASQLSRCLFQTKPGLCSIRQ